MVQIYVDAQGYIYLLQERYLWITLEMKNLCECYKSFGSWKTRKLVYKVSLQENIAVILKTQGE